MKKMMILLMILIMCLLLTDLFAYNTSRRWHAGLTAGLGKSGASFNSVTHEYHSSNYATNPAVRFAYFRDKYNGLMGWLDIGFLKMGYFARKVDTDEIVTYELEYINMNVMIGYKMNFFYFAGGLYIAPSINASWKKGYDVTSFDEWKDDFGLNAEVGVRYQAGDFTFALGCNLKYGLVNGASAYNATSRNYAILGVFSSTYAVF